MRNELDATPPKQDPFLGRLLADRYQIKRLIAKGGMGAVYEAEQRPLGRRVALKVLREPPNSSDSEAFQRRFFLEAATLAKLDHPHTVTLFDYGQDGDGVFFLVMEYVDGLPLSAVLKQEGGSLDPQRLLRLMTQVCGALSEAHQAGIVHRDLKAGNLLVSSDRNGLDHVKVVDFGLVKLTEGDQAITVTGMIMGSPHCMAPEQVQGEDVDHRADIYAVGVLLYRCLCGEYPFHGSTTTATMIAHLREPVPSLGKANPDLVLPEGLEAIVRRCLAKKPQDRFQDMTELARVLRACVEVPPEEFTAVSTILDAAPTSEPRPRKTWPWALAAVALLGVGLGAFSLLREPPTPSAALAPASVPVSLTSDPSGAVVTVNGVMFGTTPLLADLPPGPQSIELSLDGYEPLSLHKQVVAGQPLELTLSLTPVQSAPAQTAPTQSAPTQSEPPKATKPSPPKTTPKPPKAAPKPAADRPSSTSSAPSSAQKDPPPAQPDGGDEAPAGYKSNPFD